MNLFLLQISESLAALTGQPLFLSAAASLFGSGLAWELQLRQSSVYLSIGLKNANKM